MASSAPLSGDSFSDFSFLLMALTVLRIPVRCCVECSSAGICLFLSWLHQGYVIFGGRPRRWNIIFVTSYQGTYCQQALSLVIVTGWGYSWVILIFIAYIYSFYISYKFLIFHLFWQRMSAAYIFLIQICFPGWWTLCPTTTVFFLICTSEDLGHCRGQMSCTGGTSCCTFVNEQFHRLNRCLGCSLGKYQDYSKGQI